MNRLTRMLPTVTLPVMAVLLLVSSAPSPSFADADPLIEGARQCTQYFPVEEKKNSIPTHLLAAIATTESGRYHKGLGMNVPWPWTINVEGKGYYFNSKAEAIAQVQNLLASGRQSIDVGCMQVNLKHHPKAFANLNEAFDPATNVSYAARFLHDNYATLGDWIKATAAYHSRTPIYGQQYLGEIERSWNRIVGKVAEARASKAGISAQAGSAIAQVTPDGGPKVVAEIKPRVINTTRPMKESRRARVIQVGGNEARTRSEVLVVRANPTPAVALQPVTQPVTVADATPILAPTAAVAMAAPAPAVQQAPRNLAGDSVRRVSLDNSAATGVAVNGPKFVFAN